MDTHILRALYEAEHGVSGADLCRRLGVSRTAVWARIEALRALGYDIAANPHEGYRLLQSPDALFAPDLRARLNPSAILGRDIRVLDRTESTNDAVQQLAGEGHAEGLVVFAETQTQGRGRLGRHWASARGKGLWFSVLLRPTMAPSETTQLTAAAATALVRALHAETGLALNIKWPNDILIRDCKVAGILTELNADLDHVRHIVLGMGINVSHSPSDFPVELRAQAISLRQAAGKPVHRASLAAAVLRELDRDYRRILARDFDSVSEEWESHCSTLGREVAISQGPRTLRGRAEALDPSGALLLRTEHGRLERITGGDVQLIKN